MRTVSCARAAASPAAADDADRGLACRPPWWRAAQAPSARRRADDPPGSRATDHAPGRADRRFTVRSKPFTVTREAQEIECLARFEGIASPAPRIPANAHAPRARGTRREDVPLTERRLHFAWRSWFQKRPYVLPRQDRPPADFTPSHFRRFRNSYSSNHTFPSQIVSPSAPLPAPPMHPGSFPFPGEKFPRIPDPHRFPPASPTRTALRPRPPRQTLRPHAHFMHLDLRSRAASDCATARTRSAPSRTTARPGIHQTPFHSGVTRRRRADRDLRPTRPLQHTRHEN